MLKKKNARWVLRRREYLRSSRHVAVRTEDLYDEEVVRAKRFAWPRMPSTAVVPSRILMSQQEFNDIIKQSLEPNVEDQQKEETQSAETQANEEAAMEAVEEETERH